MARTQDDVAARRVVSGESWNEFCDSLKAAGAALNFPGAPLDPFNQAEGYRYLSRLARAGLMAFRRTRRPQGARTASRCRRDHEVGRGQSRQFLSDGRVGRELRLQDHRAAQHHRLLELRDPVRQLRPGWRSSPHRAHRIRSDRHGRERLLRTRAQLQSPGRQLAPYGAGNRDVGGSPDLRRPEH